jgi:aromatic ring-opening dioxygenase catalytic subunit (LigB family)
VAVLAGVFAASHSPLMVNAFAGAPAAQSAAVRRGFDDLAVAVRACEPDVVISISDDHFRAVTLESMPAFQLGIAPHSTGLGDWNLPALVLENHRELAVHLVRSAFAQGFDPAYSSQTQLDHGHMHVLFEVFGDAPPRTIPLTINTNAPPLPSLARCMAFGRALAAGIAAFPGNERVVAIASGGLSHSPSSQRIVDGLRVPADGRRGEIDRDFDARFLALLQGGDAAAVAALGDDAELERTGGRGAHEIRNWLCAWAMGGCARADVTAYQAVDAWITGMGIADLLPRKAGAR